MAGECSVHKFGTSHYLLSLQFFCIIDNMNLASLLFFVFLIIKHEIMITDLRKLVVDKLSERRGAILPNTNLDYHNNHLHVLL